MRFFHIAKLAPAFAVSIWALAGASTAWAQLSPEKAIRVRQSSYYLMGHHMSRINATLKGDAPFDKASLESSATVLDLLGRLVADHYPAGSDSGNTRAKPEVWKEAARFKELGKASQAEAAKLLGAVQGGNLDAIKAAYGSTTKSCKNCHDSFKAN
jgi:cytochrome c556